MKYPKAKPVRSEAYRRAVAALPCFLCGKAGPSQAAHADAGKGLGMKASDDTCYPLCADGPGYVGCHTKVGSRGHFTRDQRREFEVRAAEATRQVLNACFSEALQQQESPAPSLQD